MEGLERGASVEIYQLTIRITARDANRSNILQSLRRLLGPTQVRRGCRQIHLYECADDPVEIMLIVEWDGREALNAYLQSGDFGSVLSIIDVSEREPVVRVDTILAREGLSHLNAMSAR